MKGSPPCQLTQARVCSGCRDHYQYTNVIVPNHALRCRHGGGVIRAHHSVRDVLYAIAREARLTSQREDPLLLRPRIVDVSCRDSTGDIQWAIDVVVTDPQEGTLQHPPARYGAGAANQRGLEPLVQASSASSEMQLVSRLAAFPSLRTHSLASSILWRSASPLPSCAHRHRCCIAEREQIFALPCSLMFLSSPL